MTKYCFPLSAAGYNENPAARYSAHSQHYNPSAHIQYDGSPYAPQNHLVGTSQQNHSTRSDMVGLALGPPHSSGFEFQAGASSVQAGQPSNLPFDDWSRHRDNRGVEDFFSEEEIRLRSHEMLENEDMQQLLRVFSMNGHGATNIPEDGYAFSSYLPSPSLTFNYDVEKPSSGKAVVGWLKLKAALRWGIFVRKKAAERRAQIVELEEE